MFDRPPVAASPLLAGNLRLASERRMAERVGFELSRPPMDSVTYRFGPTVAVDAADAVAHCPLLSGA